MTRSAGLLRLVTLSILVSAIAPARGLSQTPCEPNPVGTWQAERAGETGASLTDRQFLVLAGRRGRCYEGGGPAFAMLIRMAGQETTVDAVGIDEAGGTPVFGAIPERTFRDFLQEPRAASDVMLRLSISSAQYQRGLKILRTWDRRARGALLCPDVFMDNVLLKQVTEDLNRCGGASSCTLDWASRTTFRTIDRRVFRSSIQGVEATQ